MYPVTLRTISAHIHRSSATGILKLCDFGFARTLAGPGARYTDYVATRWYRGPELLTGDTQYGKPVDIWAIGCMLPEMASGAPLFPGESDIDQLFHIMRCFGQLPPKLMEIFRSNPLFIGIKIPDQVQSTESLEKRFPQYSEDLLTFMRNCLKVGRGAATPLFLSTPPRSRPRVLAATPCLRGAVAKARARMRVHVHVHVLVHVHVRMGAHAGVRVPLSLAALAAVRARAAMHMRGANAAQLLYRRRLPLLVRGRAEADVRPRCAGAFPPPPSIPHPIRHHM